MAFLNLLTPSWYLPPLDSYKIDLVFPYCYATNFTHYDVLDETSWRIADDINEWLTKHCVAHWGFYVNECINEFDVLPLLTHKKIMEICKPYLAFESKDDALLFKLSV